MTIVSIHITPETAVAFFDMAMKAPEHLYFTNSYEVIRRAAIQSMIECSRLNLSHLIENASKLPNFNSEPLSRCEGEILKTLCLAQLLTAQKKEPLIEFFKNTPLKANL